MPPSTFPALPLRGRALKRVPCYPNTTPTDPAANTVQVVPYNAAHEPATSASEAARLKRLWNDLPETFSF
jgi:hypothetical protein